MLAHGKTPKIRGMKAAGRKRPHGTDSRVRAVSRTGRQRTVQTGGGQGWSRRHLSQRPGAGRAARDRFALEKASGPTKSLQHEAEAVPGPREREPWDGPGTALGRQTGDAPPGLTGWPRGTVTALQRGR